MVRTCQGQCPPCREPISLMQVEGTCRGEVNFGNFGNFGFFWEIGGRRQCRVAAP